MFNRPSSFSREVWRSVGLLLAFALVFGLYVRAEKQIDQANARRQQSFLLSDELRRSSDDLTRMARSYVLTREPKYKQYYQEILDIRSGKRPRPANYEFVYWDLVLANGPASEGGARAKGGNVSMGANGTYGANGEAIALQQRMLRAGLTASEMQKLALAEANSNRLSEQELAAMRLAEAGSAEATAMLFDQSYSQAKASIMQPIHEFQAMQEERTLVAVSSAERVALVLRFVLIAVGLSLIFMLWRAGWVLRRTLGGPVEEIHRQLSRIGSGDFSGSTKPGDDSGSEHSVLGLLAQTRAELQQLDLERKLSRSVEQFRSHILELLAGNPSLPAILEALVRGVEQLHPEMLCSVLLLDAEGQHLGRAMAPSLPAFYNAALEGVQIGPEVGSCGTAAYSGKLVLVEDIQNHPLWAKYKALAASAGLAACWSHPILSSTGQVLGTFAIYHRQVHRPLPSDLLLIEQTAHLASIAIEKQMAAQKLLESEAHYRLLTEGVSDVAWKLDRNNVFTYISPADERMRGFPADQVIGHHVFDLYTEEGIAAVSKMFRQRSETKDAGSSTMSFEVQQRCKDGSLIWTEILSTPTRDEQGRATGYHGITRNIAARKQAEEAQRIAATAFESQEGIFITDAENHMLRVNRAFTEITGYSADEALGQNPRMLKSGRHDAAFYAAMWGSLGVDGFWQSEIWNRRKSGEIFPQWITITAVKGDTDRVTHYVATFTDITQRKEAEEQIRSLAYFDPLTKLPNRRLLLDRMTQAQALAARHGTEGALLLIDLDHFKTLNDALGHDKGDLLLQQVAQRLLGCVRESDTVARLGGDEFVVILADLSDSESTAATQSERVAEKILSALDRTFSLAGFEHHSSSSIGITLFSDHKESFDELLKRADLAMYQAKAAGRNTLRFFDPQMQAVASARAALDARLREAIRDGQFSLHYQAQVSGLAVDGAEPGWRITGVEALLRWHDPLHGPVSPAVFIPLAEETGLILPLGAWVLEAACGQLASWAKEPALAHLTVAVNVSARQFHQADFVDRVLAVLARSGANPQRLKLELTESLLVANVEDIITKMAALKAQGVGFSLDDFGTGYSSLSYLKRLPLDQLKIDQSFIRDLLFDANDAVIAKMVIALAGSLGLSVIAEGVETEAQRDFLAEQGCHAYQGYLFSRPLPVAEFEQLALRQA
jgi:diguanylate cyclase (GGDEF)-like protein/PAS domain S-box-containing protein